MTPVRNMTFPAIRVPGFLIEFTLAYGALGYMSLERWVPDGLFHMILSFFCIVFSLYYGIKGAVASVGLAVILVALTLERSILPFFSQHYLEASFLIAATMITGFIRSGMENKIIGTELANDIMNQRVERLTIELSEKDIQIGRGKDRRPTDPVRENTFPGTYSFDGLIDEVKIYEEALSQKEIKSTLATYEPDKVADLEKRVLPDGEDRNTFGGYYTNLKFYDTWDNMWRFGKHSDVVVEFDNNPSKFVFWKGANYNAHLVTEKAMSSMRPGVLQEVKDARSQCRIKKLYLIM